MRLRPILTWPDDRLRTVCDPVGSEDVNALLDEMFEVMYAAPGRGLAAPQIGEMTRIFVMDATWKDGEKSPKALINPEILSASDELATYAEGCLSLPGLSLDVARPAEVRMAYEDASRVRREETFSGFAAVVAQHELDHLDGVVTLDRLTPEARAEAETSYARGAS